MRRGFASVAALSVASFVACGFSADGTGPADRGLDASMTTPTPTASSTTVVLDGDVAPPCVRPSLEFGFAEGTGTMTHNTGTVANGAIGIFSVNTGFPVFSMNVPTGAMAPPSNPSSVDFGTVASDTKSRAVDLPAPVEMATENLGAFTITGWLNLRTSSNGAGGDRIINTHKDGEDKGIDFVQDNKQLRLGVGKYNDQDNAPRSSAKLTTDSGAVATNWVFFAVIYDQKNPTDDQDGTVTYAFGDGTTLAVADAPQKYDRGVVPAPSVHALAVGNMPVAVNARNDQGSGSRIVRGLIDELRFFPQALKLEDVQCHQRH